MSSLNFQIFVFLWVSLDLTYHVAVGFTVFCFKDHSIGGEGRQIKIWTEGKKVRDSYIPFLVTLGYHSIFQVPKDEYLLLTRRILTLLKQKHKHIATNQIFSSEH